MNQGTFQRTSRVLSSWAGGILIGAMAICGASANSATNQVKIDSAYGRVPLHFEANHGQVNSPAKFLARGRGYAIHLSAGQVDFVLSSPTTTNSSRSFRDRQFPEQDGRRLAQLRMKLAGGNAAAPIVGQGDARTKVNYFIGKDPTSWRTNISTFHQVRYQAVYPGVDLVLYGNQQELEYDFVVAPGAEVRKIRFETEGARRLEINAEGDLVLHTDNGQLKQRKPIAYQMVNGMRQPVEAQYRLSRKSVGFRVGSYDRSLPLVIDPVLIYSTYAGGSGYDAPYGLAVDVAGNAYFGGWTVGTLPNITPGAFDTNYAGSIHVGGGGDAYVAKLNPTGTAFEYMTYLGGTESEYVDGLAIDDSGNAYVTGGTWSGNFPTTVGSFQPNPGDPNNAQGYPQLPDAFVTKLNSNGTALVYSTYLGGAGLDSGREIAVDSAGNAYVAGETTAANFPTLNAFQSTKKGGAGSYINLYDAFVTKLNTNGSALVFSSFLGGTGEDSARGITVDATNAVYVVGVTATTDFARTNAYQTNYGGGTYDGFVTKIAPGGSNMIFSTYLGGSLEDGFTGVLVDASGCIFAGGYTRSSNYPITNALQSTLGGGMEGCLAKLTPDGSALIFSTYMGGVNDDGVSALALGRNDDIWVTGWAGSVDFAPYANFGSINRGGFDAFVAKLNGQGNVLLNFTYLGGTGTDYGIHSVLDSQDNLYMVGMTASSDFPISSTNVARPTIGGDYDTFVAKLYFAKDELGTEVGLTWQNTSGALGQTNGTLAVTNAWDTIAALPVVVTNSAMAATTARYLRGAVGDFTYNSFVIPLDFAPGVKLDDLGDNTNKFSGDRPWFTRLLKDTRYHLSRVSSTNGPGGWVTNHYNYTTNFQNSIAAFGSAAEVTPLYLNQGYRFGVYAGAQYESTNADGAAYQTPVRVLVYRLSDFTPGQTNIVAPIATNLITVPRRTVTADQGAWDRFATNGFTVTIDTNGLRTTLHLVEQRTGAWGVTPEFANTRNGPYLLTHRAATAYYGYVIEALGVVPVGTNLYPMVTNSSGNLDWCKLYCLNFDSRPAWRSVFIDQPQFDGKPLPSEYQGRSDADDLNATLTNAITLSGSSYTNLDSSPELRRHPLLDKFVSDMAADPIGLANYVVNEIELTDALAYNETTGQASAPSVNQGGINRGALGTFLERQGSPIEQCALLVYLLRQAGYPAAYVFPTNSNVQLSDTRLSKLLRMQVKGAINDKGELYTTNSLITVNYPWVVVNISNSCVHIFPWLKDTAITEGFNLYDFLPTNYNSGDKWLRRYLSGDTNILNLSADTDAPSVLFLKLLKQYVSTNELAISLDEVGSRAFNRRNYYSRWQDFPTPTVVTNETQVVWVDSLTSSGITTVSPAMTNIFNTVSVEIVSLADTNNRITTGPLRMADLHNRRFLIATPNSTNMMLWLAPYQPTTTNQSAFDASDLALTNKQVKTITLTTNEVSFALRLSHQRHRAVNFAPDYESYLGVTETLDFTVSDRPFTRADIAALCLNAGRVTPEMLDVHARAYTQMDQQRQLNTNSVPGIEDYQGAAAYLMGMDYYSKVSRFTGVNEQLHKNRVVSWFAQGLSKLTPIKLGEQTLVRPSLDMFFNELAYGASASLRPDAGNDFLTGSEDFARILTAEIAAQEHNLINGFYRSTNTVSAVTLLRLAQQRSSASALGIIELHKNNYLTKGETNSLGYGPNKLKDNDPEIWAAVTNAFRGWDADYVRAYITPGPVAVPAAQFRGMGLVIVGKSHSASLISFNMNGAMGEQSAFFAASPASLSSSYSSGSSFDSWYSSYFDTSASYSPYIYGGNVYGSTPSSFYWDYSPWGSSSRPYRFITPVNSYPVAQYSTTFTTPSQVDLPRQINTLYNFPSSTSPAESLTRSLDRGNVGLTTSKEKGNYVADPVHVMSGEFYHAATDLTLPGPLPLSLRRNYSSHDQSDRNNFGYGWKINFVPYLSVATNTNSVVTISAAELDGSVVAYRQSTNDVDLFVPALADNPHLDNNNSDGIGSIHNRFNARLRRSIAGTNEIYTLSGADGSTRVFQVAAFPVVGLTNTVTRQRPYLQTWSDSRSNVCSFSFGSDTNAPEYGQLVRIQSGNGSFIGLNYNAGGYITEGYTGDGRRVRYEYDDFGDLTRVILPDLSEEVYEYQHTQFTNNNIVYVDSTHLLTKEIKPGGRLLENFYDSLRRVSVQKATVGSDFKTYTNGVFTYSNNFSLTNSLTNGITGLTNLKDVNNNTTTYRYTNSLIHRIEFPLSVTVTQQWFYTNGAVGAYQRSLQSRTDARGLKTSYLYDTNGNATNITFTGLLTGFATTNETAAYNFTYNSNQLMQTASDPVGNQRLVIYDTNFVFLPAFVVNLTSNVWISSNRFEYYSVTNGARFACGLPKRITRGVGSPDAAVAELDHDARGFLTRSVNFSGTTDPNVTNYFVFNGRGELIERADAAGRIMAMGFDGRGNPQFRDVWDNGALLARESFYYNSNGELEWRDGPRSGPEDFTRFDYDGAGRLTSELRWRSQAKTDGTGVEAPSGYDLYAQTFHEYDKFGNLTRSIDPRGAITTNLWDALGRLTQRKFYDLNGTTILSADGFAYEAGGSVTRYTNALGGVAETLYLSSGQPYFSRSADTSTNAWRYYLDGRVRREIQHNGAYWETTYDDALRRVTKIFYSASGTPLATTAIEFDRRGNLIKSTDAAGNTTTNLFDGLDRLKISAGPPIVTVKEECPFLPNCGNWVTNVLQQTVTNFYDAAGVWLTNVNTLGEKSITRFDGLGRPIRVEIRDKNQVLIRETSIGYSADHQSVTVTNGSGADAIVSTTFTDNDGQPLLSIAYPYANVREFTRNTFDLAGNLLVQARLSATNTSLTTWQISTNSYDGLNRLRSQAALDNAVTTFEYDAAGNVTNRVMPGGALKWQARYNNAGQMLEEKNVGSGSVATRTNTYVYYPSTTLFAGLLQTRKDGRGVLCTNIYDEWFRPVTNSFAGTLSEQNLRVVRQYDVRGFVTNIIEQFTNSATGPATTVQHRYDSYGQLMTETIVVGSNTFTSAGLTWDAAGRRSTLVLGSIGYNFGWRADGTLASAALNQYGTATYGYNTAGLLNTRTVGARLTTTSSRDGMGRPLSIGTTISGVSKLAETLTWTGDGLLNTHSLQRVGDFTDDRAYSYADNTRRLVGEQLNLNASTRWTNFYTFDGGTAAGPGVLTKIGQTPSSSQWSGITDAFARVNRETNTVAKQLAYGRVNGPATITALLDGVPQPVTVIGTGNSLWTNQWRSTFELSAGTHQLTVSAAHPSGVFTTNATSWFTNNLGALTVTNVMDAAGFLTQRIWRKANGATNLVQTLTWDARGRLYKVTERDSSTNGRDFTVVYDAFGRRLQTTEIIVTNNVALTNQPIIVSHYFDPSVEFLELGVTDNGKTSWKLMGPDMDGVYGGQNGTGGFEAEASGLTFSTLLSDSLGNIHGAYDSSLHWHDCRLAAYGGVSGYRPFTLGSSGSLAAKYAWRNRATDAVGFSWMGGNWLDPQSGSFLSFDPLGHLASDSGYSFSRGNPLSLSFWDADGRGKNPGFQSLSERIQSRSGLSAWEAAATAQTCMDCHSRLDVLMAGYMPYDQPWYNRDGVNAVGVRMVGGMKVAAGTAGIIAASTVSSTGIGSALGGPVLLGSSALIKSGGNDIKTGSFSTLVADDMIARGSSPQDAAEMEVLLSAVLLADGMAVKPTIVNIPKQFQTSQPTIQPKIVPGLPARVPLDRFPYPKHPTSRILGAGVEDGTYVFVQDVRGTVHVAQNGPHMHPQVLGNATPVASAGEITIQNGIVTEINNLSGTFKPSPTTLDQVGRAVQTQGLSVAPGAIKPFQWPSN
ncbi:MAG: SBBP repeat-containing protein [Verrucomicrobiota bacterium]